MWGRARRDKAIVKRFVAALNARDLAALEDALDPDFTYIDSWREGVTGRHIVLPALSALFDSDPDFGIEVDSMDFRDPFVLMTGRVNSARFGMGRRAVWQVLVEGGSVKRYQAWAEGGPPPMSRTVAPDAARPLPHLADPKPDMPGE